MIFFCIKHKISFMIDHLDVIHYNKSSLCLFCYYISQPKSLTKVLLNKILKAILSLLIYIYIYNTVLQHLTDLLLIFFGLSIYNGSSEKIVLRCHKLGFARNDNKSFLCLLLCVVNQILEKSYIANKIYLMDIGKLFYVV